MSITSISSASIILACVPKYGFSLCLWGVLVLVSQVYQGSRTFFYIPFMPILEAFGSLSYLCLAHLCDIISASPLVSAIGPEISETEVPKDRIWHLKREEGRRGWYLKVVMVGSRQPESPTLTWSSSTIPQARLTVGKINRTCGGGQLTWLISICKPLDWENLGNME